MIIFLDLDGVIINFIEGVCNWYGIPYEPEKVTHWNALPELTNTSYEDFWRRINTPLFWKELNFYPYAKLFITELQKHGEVILLSSPARGCAGYRQNWIQNNLPDFFYSGNYILTPNKAVCANRNTILIDDADHNCISFAKAGGFAILYPQPWNIISSALEYL
jgi:5'(3')-deoxyribonucleotidase